MSPKRAIGLDLFLFPLQAARGLWIAGCWFHLEKRQSKLLRYAASMSAGLIRYALAIACLVVAGLLPFAALRTANEVDRPPVITLPGAAPDSGLFPAPWTASWTGLATLVGVLLPLLLLGVATYVLVRRPSQDQPTDQ